MERKYLHIRLLILSILLISPMVGLILQNKGETTAVDTSSSINSRSTIAWETDGVVVCNYDSTQNINKMVPDGKGGSIVVWADNRGGDNDIYAQRLDSNGTTLWTANGTNVIIETGSQFFLKAVSDGDGGVIVAWQDSRITAYDIYTQRISKDGNKVWGDTLICNALGEQRDIEMVSDGSGGAILVWRDQRSGSMAYGQRVDSAGNVKWDLNGTLVGHPTETNQREPVVMSDGSNGAFVAWWDWRNGNYDIFVQHVDGTGNKLWNANGVEVVAAADSQFNPEIVSDETGGVIIAWTDYRTSVDYDVYAQRIDSSGNKVWNPSGVPISVAINDQFYHQLVPDGAGGAIITWYDDRNALDRDIFAQRIDSTGNIQWLVNGKAICTATGDQEYAELVSDGLGGAIVTWVDNRSGNQDIYAQWIDSNGNPNWTVNGIPICTAVDTQRSPAIVYDGIGGVVMSWLDYRTGSADIYAQRISGIPLPPGDSIPGFELLYMIVGLIGLGMILARKKYLN